MSIKSRISNQPLLLKKHLVFFQLARYFWVLNIPLILKT